MVYRSENWEDGIVQCLGTEIRTVTIVGRDAVYYAVEQLEVDELGVKEWATVWSRTVPFRKDRAHSPGGAAFSEAARNQIEEAVQRGETGDA